MSIYLDNLATTPTDPRVDECRSATSRVLKGNPDSAEHSSGKQANGVSRASAEAVAGFIGHNPDNTMFAPSASSALWIAVQDAINRGGSRRISVIASAIEHPSLLRHLVDADRQARITLTLCPVTKTGQLDLEALRGLCRERVDLICVMAANNEIGTLNPIADVLSIAEAHGARTLIDASQSAGRIAMADVLARADHVVINGSKMYGPRGIGVLAGALMRRTQDGLHALFGTADPAAAAAMAEACNLRSAEMDADETRIARQRDALETYLMENVDGLVVNGDRDSRLAGALHISAPGAPGEAVVARLLGKVDVSTGAACQSGVPGPSHVLSAMKLDDWILEGAVRLCVGKFNRDDEMLEAGRLIASALQASSASQARRYA